MTDETRPLADLTALQRDVLAQLAQIENKPIGREIADELEDSYGQPVVYTTVTNALAALEQMGLVASERDGREKHYRVTDAGERELNADIRWRQSQ